MLSFTLQIDHFMNFVLLFLLKNARLLIHQIELLYVEYNNPIRVFPNAHLSKIDVDRSIDNDERDNSVISINSAAEGKPG